MSVDDILGRLLSEIPDDYDKTVGSFFYDAEKPIAIEADRLYQAITDGIRQAFAATATGANLDAKLADVGMHRLPAMHATGAVLITGTDGAYIPIGTILKAGKMTFATTEAATIADGSAEVSAWCQTEGPDGNIPAFAITGFSVTVPGLDEATNTDPFVGGRYAETDEEARKRLLDALANPPASGNEADYVQWALEVPGVSTARCIPLWDGDGVATIGEDAGCVTVIVLGDAYTTPTADLLTAVEDHIAPVKPIGADLYVKSPTEISINITARLTLSTGYSLTAAVRGQLDAAIAEYYKSCVREQRDISAAQIGRILLDLPFVEDYTSFTVSGSAADPYEVPVKGVYTWTT